MTKMPNPRDPVCGRLAADMSYLDDYWAENDDEIAAIEETERQRRRAEYVRLGDGTYNPTNGHFYCDACYIALGTPLGVAP